MPNIFKTTLPAAVYSSYAENIITDFAAAAGLGFEAERDENGRVRLVQGVSAWKLPKDIGKLFGEMLQDTAQPGKRNTGKARGEDCRLIKLGQHAYEARAVSLVALIELKRHSASSLVRWFGKDLYDEIVGKPLNPVRSVKRMMLCCKMDALREKFFADSATLWHDWNKRSSAIFDRHAKDLFCPEFGEQYNKCKEEYHSELRRLSLEFERNLAELKASSV